MDPNGYKRLRLLQEALAFMKDGVMIVDVEGRPIFVNEVGRKLLQKEFSPDLPLSHQIGGFGLYHPDGRPMSFEETPLGRALSGEVVPDFLLTFPRHDESSKYMRTRATPVWDDSGNFIGAVSIFNDATTQLTVEDALKESEQKFQQACCTNPVSTTDEWSLRDGKHLNSAR